MESRFRPGRRAWLVAMAAVFFGVAAAHAQNINTFAGGGSAADNLGDGGKATDAAVNGPRGLIADAAGNVIFADVKNHRVRRIDASGVITTIAGNGQAGFSGDGAKATDAQLNN